MKHPKPLTQCDNSIPMATFTMPIPTVQSPAIELQEDRLNEIPVNNNNNEDDDGNQVDEEIPSNQSRPKRNCTCTSDTIYKNFECNR